MRNQLTHASSTLKEKTAAETTSTLQEWLTAAIDLMMQARQAHWKVRDPHFSTLHVLFDKIYTDAEICVDLIAGRLVQLGGIAQDALRVTAQKLGPLDIARGQQHVAEQAGAIAFYVELMRQAVSNATQVKNADMNLWCAEAQDASEN